MNAALVGARELIGPIIAMTITLAAVYTPIALQGGLTGALFREFALTLAGAVFISGVVALVLSPMMCANLLRAEHGDHGFSGWVNRTFDRFRDWYGSHLDRTLNARPAVYIVWIGVTLLAVLMFVAIPKSRRKSWRRKKTRDVIFGIITAPANATIDDTIRYADAAGKIFKDIPDTRFTFQITFPDNRFWRPGPEAVGRAKDANEGLPAGRAAEASRNPGHSNVPDHARSLPGADNFPVSFVIASTASQERILDFAKQIFAKAMAGAHFSVWRHRYQDRPAAGSRSSSTMTRSRPWGSTCSRSARISPPASAEILLTGSTWKA